MDAEISSIQEQNTGAIAEGTAEETHDSKLATMMTEAFNRQLLLP